MNGLHLNRIYWRLTGVVMLAVIAALAANAYVSHRSFERALLPEMAKKATVIGGSLRLLILKAVENGIDFNELYGVDQAFTDVASENPDFSYMAVTNTRGTVLYEYGKAPARIENYLRAPETAAKLLDTNAIAKPAYIGEYYFVSLSIENQGTPLGLLHIGVDAGFVENIMIELLLDVLVVLVVALFVTLELLNFIAGTRLEASLQSVAALLERGRSGNFALPSKSGVPTQEMGGLRDLLTAAIQQLNAAYNALARDIDAAGRAPAHERPRLLSAARTELEALRARYKLGMQEEQGDSKQGQLARVRAPLFAFILAEELTRSFLPAYVTSLLTPIAGISPQIVVGLPIVLFMLIVALGQPYFGAFSERLGHRQTMNIGAGIAAVGFIASALAASVLDLLIWRSLCAVGYGFVFVAAQGFVLQHTELKDRTRGFALFVGAIMVATICGPSIGGILADNIGGRATFGISALLAVASIFAIGMMPDASGPRLPTVPTRGPGLREIFSLMLNRRFMTLTGLAAIPAKVLLTGVCFYLMPLYLLSIGSTQSMAGRMLMVYGVVMVIMVPVAATMAKSQANREWLVASGLLVSGLGGFLMIVSASVPWIFAAMVLVGLGQALSITAQSALVGEHCLNESDRLGSQTVYGVYRLLERLGNAMGPLVAAVLVMAYSYQASFAVIGGMLMMCAITFVLLTRVGRGRALAVAG